VEGLAPFVELFDVSGDAALGLKVSLNPGDAVVQVNRESGVEVGELFEPVGEPGEVIFDLAKDFAIGQEGDGRARVGGLADDLKVADFLAALEFLIVSFAVAADFDFEKL